jgi:Transmembrane secretion effector
VRGLRPMYAAHAISMAGTVAAEVALSILVYQRSHSPLLSALVLVVSFLPWGLGGTVLSAVADRFPARPLLVTCDLVSATAVAAMLVPRMPVFGLLGLLLLIGLVAPLFQGARAASLAYLLPADLFPVGRALLRSISQAMLLTGFAAGALVVAAVGPKWMLGADAASFLVSATLLRFGTTPTPASSQAGGRSPRSVLRESMQGLRYVFGHGTLRRLLVLSWAVPAFSSAPDGLAVAYTAQLGSAVTSAGLLFTGYAAGAILGEVALARRSNATRRRLLLPLVLLCEVPALFFVFGPPLALAAALLMLTGAGTSFNQGLDPRILEATEPSYRGRLFTIQSSGLMTVQGIGIGLAGVIGVFVPARYVIAGIAATGTIVLGLLARRVIRQGAGASAAGG